MAEDLDRAYVINGDDLRIALAGLPVISPRDVAEYILGKYAAPLGSEVGRAEIDDDGPCEFIRDTEIAAMAAIVATLDTLDPAACSRVLDWAKRRFAVDVPF